MEVWAPTPSPIALFLLELDAREAEGSVEIGGRTVVLRRGRVVDVRRAPGDLSLHEFLRETGRIDERDFAILRASSADPDRLPEGSTLLTPAWVAETLRALWLDRLVRGLVQAESSGLGPPVLQPTVDGEPSRFDTALVLLVLDALERRAQEGDAERVGSLGHHVVEWVDGPHLERARRWAGLEAVDETRVGALLGTTGATAARIAALVRAGVARIVSPHGDVSPPARQTPTLPPATVASTENRPAAAPELPRRSATEVPIGAAQAFADVSPFDVTLPELPTGGPPLADPLDPIERELAALEDAGAPGSVRAARWRQAAEVWSSRYRSVEERARVLREAAAAQPDDPTLLLEAAEACAAVAQSELALAYARAAVTVANGPARDDARLALGMLARRTGLPEAALSAFRAASSSSRATEARLLAARVLVTQGRIGEAVDEILGVLPSVSETDPERAEYLAWAAWWLMPGATRPTEALIATLFRAGRGLAAMAVRADSARRASDPDVRRAQLLGAAEAAEAAGRPLLAADYLIRLLDSEPELEVLYEPLDVDLEAAGLMFERAVLLEELATVCPPEARVHWLGRAADARLEIPGDSSWELELRMACLALDPQNVRALAAVRSQVEVTGEMSRLADVLEHALRSPEGRSAEKLEPVRRQLLEDLAHAAEAGGEPLRAAWARSVLAALSGERSGAQDPLQLAARAVMERVAELEQSLCVGTPEERRAATVELARIWAQDPERRERAVALLTAHLEESWNPAAADLLERIHALRGDVSSVVALLERRVAHEERRSDRARRLLRIAALESARGNYGASARACLRLLEEIPGHREALVRLRRAATRLGDAALLCDAIAREARLVLPVAEKSRLLTLLATRLEASGDFEGARRAAVEALEVDPDASEAALILAWRLAGGATAPPWAIARARQLLGDLPPLLEAAVRTAEDEGTRAELVQRWARLDPIGPKPYLVELHVALEQGAFERAIETARVLADDLRAEAASVDLLVFALERAGTAFPERAAEVALRCGDRFGQAASALRELGLSLALRTHSLPLQIAAYERALVGAPAARAIEILRAIAELHRRRGDRCGEVRTWLRLLARLPRDPEAIDRLAAIYAEAGEYDRLMAALALRIVEGASEQERFEGWVTLAVASARVLGDTESAESFARSALDGLRPVQDDAAFARVVRVAGVLTALGRPEPAVDLLCTEARRASGIWAARLAEHAAALALRSTGDVSRALAICVEGLLASPGYGPLIVAFEQLALECKDVALAERTYRSLAEGAMGAHSRRAVLDRRARWLERAGEPRAALEAYLEAAREAASPGVILTAIERVAREIGDLEALCRGLALLVHNARHPVVRVAILRRAADLLDQELGRPERAFELFFPIWKESGLSELEALLVRLGARMLESTPELGTRALDDLVDELLRRADEAWMGEEKARLRMKAARIEARARGDLARAEALAVEALALLRSGDDPERTHIAEVLAEVADWLRGDPSRLSDARAYAQRALEADPHAPSVRAVAAALGVELPSPLRSESPSSMASAPKPSPRPSTAGIREPEEPARAGPPETFDARVGDLEEFDHGASAPAAASTDSAPRGSGNGTRAPSRALPAPSIPLVFPAADDSGPPLEREEGKRSPTAEWFPAAVPGGARVWSPPIALPLPTPSVLASTADSPEELEAHARALGEDPATAAEAVALYRAALVLDPGRVTAIEAIANLAERAGGAVEAAIARGVLGVIDPGSEPETRPLALDAAAIAARRDELLRNPEHAVALRLLATVWESALPIFRVTLAQLGVLGTDRVTPHTAGPTGRALAAVLRSLPGTDPVVFATRRPDVSVLPVRTQPPSVLIGSAAPNDEPSLRFLLGRAIELARPEHVLIATLEETEARALFGAIRAAFGPADDAAITGEAAALVPRLWNTIPARVQRELTDLLLAADASFEYDRLAASIHAGAARAGLLASGHVAASVRALIAVDPALAGIRVEDARSFAEAVKRSKALADLLRFAFGDAFVDVAWIG